MTAPSIGDPPRKPVLEGAAVCWLAFCVLFAYGLARSPIESLFLQDHGVQKLPWAWLTVAASTAVAVLAYWQAARRFTVATVFLGALLLSSVLQFLCMALGDGASFALYVWKDVHVVVLVELVWTTASLTLHATQARWIYGFMCVSGSLGSILGAAVVHALANPWGTRTTLWLAPAAFLFTAASVWVFRDLSGLRAHQRRTASAHRKQTSATTKPDFAYLPWMVALIALVQVVITLTDYEYNVWLAQDHTALDERTRVVSRVNGILDLVSLFGQLSSGWVIKTVGVRWILMAIPTLVVLGTGVYALYPGFMAAAAGRVTVKSMDYSLHRTAKEMLYLPLSFAAKTRGKALVDMFTYRGAKASASALVLLVQASARAFVVVPMLFVLSVAWWFVSLVLTRRYEQHITQRDQITAKREPTERGSRHERS